MKKILFLTMMLLFSLSIAGCTGEESVTNSNADLTIYTSVYPIQYAVERIGGETVNAISVFPPGVDAHTYEPTSKEMATLAKSDAFIYIGSGMEGFTESMAEALHSQDIALIALGEHEELFTGTHEKDHHDEDQQEDHGHENEDEHDSLSHDGHNHGDHDPHVWLDPLRMIELAHIIEETLSELNPDKAKLYQENLHKLENELIALDDEFINTLEGKTTKQILVAHAAYGYWEERYGIEQIAINGLSSSSEPSQKELTEIIEQAEESNLQYIIFEQNSSNRVSEIIQEHIGAETLIIHNLSVLTETDLEANEDYLSLMRKNLDVLDKATN